MWAIGTLQLRKQPCEEDCRACQASSLTFYILGDNKAALILLKEFGYTQAAQHIVTIDITMRQWMENKQITFDFFPAKQLGRLLNESVA